MADEVNSIVDPNDSGSGYSADYTSLYNWEDGENGDLTGVRDEVAIADCRSYNGDVDDDPNVAIDGWTTSATQYIKIFCDTAYRHPGYWDANKYRFSRSHYGAMIDIKENYVRIEGLQIYNTHGTNGVGISQTAPNAESASDQRIEKCIVRDCTEYGINVTNETNIAVVNNIVYDCDYGIRYYDYTESPPTWVIYNNTVVDCTTYGVYAYQTGTGYVHLKNNCVFNCSDDYRGTFSADSEYNAWSDAGGDPASSGVDLTQAGTALFNDYSGDDFRVKDTDSELYDAGTDLSTDPDGYFDVIGDIDGSTRSQWDIGADEYVAAGGSVTLSADLAAAATLAAGLVVAGALSADLAVTGALSADLSATRAIAASFAVAETLSADLGVTRGVSADLAVTETLAGDFVVARALSASLSVTETLSADLTIGGSVTLSADLAVTETISADLVAARALSASLAVTEALSADLTIDGAITFSASLAVTEAISADLIAARALTADLAVTETLSADLTVAGETVTLSADIAASAGIAADLAVARALAAGFAVTESLSASITLAAALAANLTVTETLSGVLTVAGAYVDGDFETWDYLGGGKTWNYPGGGKTWNYD